MRLEMRLRLPFGPKRGSKEKKIRNWRDCFEIRPGQAHSVRVGANELAFRHVQLQAVFGRHLAQRIDKASNRHGLAADGAVVEVPCVQL
jgi:hypothetical protein